MHRSTFFLVGPTLILVRFDVLLGRRFSHEVDEDEAEWQRMADQALLSVPGRAPLAYRPRDRSSTSSVLTESSDTSGECSPSGRKVTFAKTLVSRRYQPRDSIVTEEYEEEKSPLEELD